MELFENILALLSGIGVFIVGMNLMSSNLQKASGAGLKRLIGKITNNKILGISIGAAVTGLIHSSAATTIMVIGFVNAGAMALSQAVPVIMGANIGTTITGLIVSLASFDINIYASVMAFIGVMMMFFKNNKVKNIGGIVAGCGLLFIGLTLMSDAFKSEAISNVFYDIFQKIDFPIVLLLIGIISTAILQSSGAMTGLIIVMAANNVLSLNDSLFIILGANIGTCFMTLLSTVSASTNAKRAGLIHLIFNTIGVFIFTVILWIFNEGIVNLLNRTINNTAFEVAIFHIIFNVSTTLILLPFTNQLVKLVNILIKEKQPKFKSAIKYIDDHLLITPAVAAMQVRKEVINMAEITKENLIKAGNAMLTGDLKDEKIVYETEDAIDYMNRFITSFLIKLFPLIESPDNKKIGAYFHVVNDIERIGDHAENFMDLAKEMKEKELLFSAPAIKELNEMIDVLAQMYELALQNLVEQNEYNLIELSKLEIKTDALKQQLTASHYERLSQNNCTMELGAYYTSVVAAMERIGDHLVNIGYSVTNPTGSQIDLEK